ncbi:MAG: serine protease [Thermoanaerobaculia bacterium]
MAQAQKSAENLLTAHHQLEESFIFGQFSATTAAAAGAAEARGFENVVGVGVGQKITGGSLTGTPCVTVYVVDKVAPERLAPGAVVPRQVGSVPTDVLAVGEITAQRHVGRMRPAPAGVSVAHPRVTAGTIGAKVYRGRNAYILSNNHVLANSNNARRGDSILQPGPADGGREPADTIGTLHRFVPMDFSGRPNLVDCATARIRDADVTADILNIGPFDRRREAVPYTFQVVVKTGRTTQTTLGLVTDTNFTGRIGYGLSGSAVFRNQIVVSGVGGPFSQGGDSGSLVIEALTRRPMGLLFAGSPAITLVNPIRTVMRSLAVRF